MLVSESKIMLRLLPCTTASSGLKSAFSLSKSTFRSFSTSSIKKKALENWKRPSIAEIGVPAESWEVVYSKNQKKFNLQLLAGVGLFSVTAVVAYKTVHTNSTPSFVHETGFVTTLPTETFKLGSSNLSSRSSNTVAVIEETVAEAVHVVGEVVEVVKDSANIVKEAIEKADDIVVEVKKVEDDVKVIVEDVKVIETDSTRLVHDVKEVVEEAVDIATEIKDLVVGTDKDKSSDTE